MSNNGGGLKRSFMMDRFQQNLQTNTRLLAYQITEVREVLENTLAEKIRLVDLKRTIEEHVDMYYQKRENGKIECKTCGSEIMEIKGNVSEHAKEISLCVGSGDTKKLTIPYCPNCEEKPELPECIHV